MLPSVVSIVTLRVDEPLALRDPLLYVLAYCELVKHRKLVIVELPLPGAIVALTCTVCCEMLPTVGVVRDACVTKGSEMGV